MDFENQGRKSGGGIDFPAFFFRGSCDCARGVNYWRGIHAEALQRAFGDIEGLNAVGSDVLIAGRIKKLPTIVDKLGRPDAPSDLQTMYDIAGCRLVVPDLATLERVYSEIACLPAFDAPKTKRHDYIAYPRPSG